MSSGLERLAVIDGPLLEDATWTEKVIFAPPWAATTKLVIHGADGELRIAVYRHDHEKKEARFEGWKRL